ncbi:hypothetical protein COLO4_06642 [Corchorus olitorius]|uniref:Uncharacterized protein n=1 Tax=Corchorus olitorius TaxID=93759 RepID=A0A1R3KME5_9ROSI|nr:hypothetical protein COLO4_06642 [Corchorus olitorius]
MENCYRIAAGNPLVVENDQTVGHVDLLIVENDQLGAGLEHLGVDNTTVENVGLGNDLLRPGLGQKENGQDGEQGNKDGDQGVNDGENGHDGQDELHAAEVEVEVDGEVDLDGLREQFADGCAYFEEAEEDDSGAEDPEVSEARVEFRSVREKFLEALEKRGLRGYGYVPIDPDEAGPSNVEPYDEPYYSTDECGDFSQDDELRTNEGSRGQLGIGSASFAAQFISDKASGSSGNATVNLTSDPVAQQVQPQIPENVTANSKTTAAAAAGRGKSKVPQAAKGKGKPPKSGQPRATGRVTVDEIGRMLSTTEPQFRTSPKSMEKMFGSRHGGAGPSNSAPMTASPGWVQILRSNTKAPQPDFTTKKKDKEGGERDAGLWSLHK